MYRLLNSKLPLCPRVLWIVEVCNDSVCVCVCECVHQLGPMSRTGWGEKGGTQLFPNNSQVLLSSPSRKLRLLLFRFLLLCFLSSSFLFFVFAFTPFSLRWGWGAQSIHGRFNVSAHLVVSVDHAPLQYTPILQSTRAARVQERASVDG